MNTKSQNNIILLHALDLEIEDPLVYLVNTNTQLGIQSSFSYKKNQYFVIKLNQNLEVNSKILISIQFERTIGNDETTGLFMKKFVDLDMKTK